METKIQDNFSPFITVIICTFNRMAFLRDCLHSFIEQNLPRNEYEIIVSDDGSTDKTTEMVKQVISSNLDSCIRYFPQIHTGVNAARNLGIKHSQGKVNLFFDDDQLAPPEYLSRIKNAFL